MNGPPDCDTHPELLSVGAEDDGEVDRSLIDYCLSLTPAERLRQVEEYAGFVISARERNRRTWSDSDRS